MPISSNSGARQIRRGGGLPSCRMSRSISHEVTSLRSRVRGGATISCAADRCKVQYHLEKRTLRVEDFPYGTEGAVPFTVSGGIALPSMRGIYGTRDDGKTRWINNGKGDGRLFLDAGDEVAVFDQKAPNEGNVRP